MLTYARSKDSTVTQSNYFTVASRRLLGTEQAVQFQSGNQYGSGWHWGSKCTADNVCNESSAHDNALAQMPRSYSNGNGVLGVLYNWYAAVSESGDYSMTSGTASDSICPSGWQLPVYGGEQHNINKSYGKLLFTDYEVPSGEGLTSNKIPGQIPLSATFPGYYVYASGNHRAYAGTYVVFHTSTATTHIEALEEVPGAGSMHIYINFNNEGTGVKSNGFSIRCVKR